MLSKTHILTWTVFSILMFSACRMQSQEEHTKSNGQKIEALEAVVPATFKLFMGFLPGIETHELEWDGEALRYEAFGPHNLSKPAPKMASPSAEQWRAFWKKMEKVRVWEWCVEYEPKAVVADGCRWSLQIELSERKVTSSGRNAFPGDFEEFRNAVGALVGQETFP